jgi:hypothetical protein
MIPNGQSFRPVFRGLRVAALAAIVQLGSSFVQAAAPSALVLIGNGFNAGLRQGMVCRITRGSAEIAEVVLVELRPSTSAALILTVAPKQSIRPGDLAAVKVLKS